MWGSIEVVSLVVQWFGVFYAAPVETGLVAMIKRSILPPLIQVHTACNWLKTSKIERYYPTEPYLIAKKKIKKKLTAIEMVRHEGVHILPS